MIAHNQIRFYGHPMYISDIIVRCLSAKIIIYHKQYLLREIYLPRRMKSIDKKWWRHKLQIKRFSRIFPRFDFFTQYIGIMRISTFEWHKARAFYIPSTQKCLYRRRSALLKRGWHHQSVSLKLPLMAAPFFEVIEQCPVSPHAYSSSDRCDQCMCWNGRLPIFTSLTPYHSVTCLQKPMLNRIRWQYCSACSSNSGSAPWWMTHPGRF